MIYKVIFVSMFLSSIVYGNVNLNEIREAIKRKGATWTAGSTSIWKLSLEERKLLCGTHLELPPSDVPVYKPMKVTLYDDSLDWRCRTYNGYTNADWTTPAKGQKCGDCWAFATNAVLESRINVSLGVPNLAQNLSEQYLVADCYPTSDCESGGNIYYVAVFVRDQGVPDEACFPYLGIDTPCNRCVDWDERIIKITDLNIISASVDAIKDALLSGPVVAAMSVYGDFQSYSSGIYEHITGEFLGGHAIIIGGWNDNPSDPSKPYWICKNSWGRYWGEGGWFRIKQGDCEINDYCIYLGTPSVATPKITYVYSEISEITGDFDGVVNPGEEVDVIINIMNESIYKTATSVSALLRTTNANATIIDSTGSYLDIPGGTTAASSSDKFRVDFADTMIAVPFTLDVTATSYFTELEFSIKIGLDQFGWPSGVGQVRSSPIAIDLDGDAQKEIIFGTDGGEVYVKNTSGDNEPGFPFQATGKLWSAPAVGDVDADGELEIVIGSWEDTVYIIKKNGTVLTRKALGDKILATPTLSDLDGDGDLEIIVGGYDGYLYVFNHDGTDYSGFPFLLASGAKVFSGVAVGYVDGDTVKDIVVGCTDKKVYVVSSNGSLLSGWPFTAGGSIQGAPSIVDSLNPKIAVGSSDKKLYVLDASGNEIFSVLTGGQIKGSPSFVDLDGDGEAELIFGSSDSNVYVYKEGTFLTGWPKSLDSGIDGEISFADLDNNGFPEIIVTTTGGYLWIYDKDGTLLEYLPIYSETSTLTSPAIADIDSDGDIEVVFGSTSGIHIIDIKSQGSVSPWSMYRCNPHRTGYYGGTFVAVEEKSLNQPVYLLSHIWPNPLDKKSAQINYTFCKPSQVQLSIYNSVGQELTTLVNKLQSPGTKSVTWDATGVTSGIYFYKLKAGEFECTRKIIILK